MNRDFIGYGRYPPGHSWPDNARIAVNFVINYEEGAESNILDEDKESEAYLTDIPAITALANQRHLSSESMFEYGSRAGIWRLVKLFDQYKIPLTFFAAGLALERNPEFAQYLKESAHEVAGHGYRWINYRVISKDQEREHFHKTLQVIHSLTGKTVKGWYTGRGSQNTLDLVREFKLLYSSDSYADDLPHEKEGILFVPYSLDTNDARYAVTPGFSNGEQFFGYLKDAFDCLYREGENSPKMMTVGLHGRISGRPGRTEAIRKFLEYVHTHPKVWLCRREEIAEHWLKGNKS